MLVRKYMYSEPPKRDLQRETVLGTGCLVLVERLVPSQRLVTSQRFSFKFIVCQYNLPHDQSIKITMLQEPHNDESICLVLSTSCELASIVLF